MLSAPRKGILKKPAEEKSNSPKDDNNMLRLMKQPVRFENRRPITFFTRNEDEFTHEIIKNPEPEQQPSMADYSSLIKDIKATPDFHTFVQPGYEYSPIYKQPPHICFAAATPEIRVIIEKIEDLAKKENIPNHSYSFAGEDGHPKYYRLSLVSIIGGDEAASIEELKAFLDKAKELLKTENTNQPTEPVPPTTPRHLC